MTMIKKDGHWVTVAGGQRMWVGTKAQLDAALAAGELEDGTAVMVTDDYHDTMHPHPDWANAVAITAAQLYAGYTAPSDGMIFIDALPLSSGTGISITINNVKVSEGYRNGDYNMSTSISTPVSTGDVIKSSAAIYNPVAVFTFVPWKA